MQDDTANKTFTELLTQPSKVASVVAFRRASGLDFDGEYAPAAILYDQVHFTSALLLTEVKESRSRIAAGPALWQREWAASGEESAVAEVSGRTMIGRERHALTAGGRARYDVVDCQGVLPDSTCPRGTRMGAKTDLLQGSLDLLILKVLALGPLHGWGISKRISQLSGDILDVGQGSLYPALYRLEDRGWIRSKWGTSPEGRRAKFYSLTAAGRRQFAQEEASWRLFAGAVDQILQAG